MVARSRGRYGVDGPGWAIGLGASVLVPLLAVAAGAPRRLLRIPAVTAAPAGLFLHASVRGKFLVWEELLDGLGLRGDEQVLDLGCGRGAVLTAVARRVPRGRVTGVDLWRSVDQSGNRARTTLDNAGRERVAERIDLVTADMRELPLEDDRFDLVISSMALHNITDARGRAEAVCEAYRVLRPGGRLLIVDIFHTAQYRDLLLAAGARNVTRADVGHRMWWSGPWVPTKWVRADKPALTRTTTTGTTGGTA
ncbi:class I SAM-dependent methyltransferase [Streptomyces cinnabarinus]|uniref:Class I SAM-dependent methyltransferase n=1 Tax=Streptomyces cinnabarinus TaxID=67287 RepID=A0ABY7KM54_9ACTN|nr:class I SAM-dependent methyltransferase [Streptomyces cinnabarinus]WAZ24021.1 class I SAM-dependent methyltransferase [Streptomyces cinnabarinus]